MNKIKGKLVEQNGIYFAEFSNKKYNDFCAYIINQKDAKHAVREYKGSHLFDIIALVRPSRGFQNLHVYRVHSCYNLIGTNGNVDELKDLLKYDYIPSLVNFVK